MKNNSGMMIFTMILIVAAFVGTNPAQTCADFKNKTYVAFGETVFDNASGNNRLEGAFAFKVKFNADGTSGTARFLTVHKLNNPTADQQTMTFSCTAAADGGTFTLTEKNKGDNGYFLFKSYDKGARVRLKSYLPARGTPFWMIEQPAAPSVEQFPQPKS